jgi:sirohydrochlorin ferrochelatase
MEAHETGIIIVDHGSSRQESNDMLLRFVDMFREHSRYAIVEAAHMELAEPSIRTAFRKCVDRGARRVVVSPYFLLPGKHWHRDIPALTADAARDCPGIPHVVTAPIGLHPMMAQVIESRVDHCLEHVAGRAPECDVCAGTGRCRLSVAG